MNASQAIVFSIFLASASSSLAASPRPRAPNILFVFADQWRADATGYAGDPNVKTPNLDRLADQAIMFTHAVSGCPVCSPYRGSLLTGQRPLTHGVFVNDVQLPGEALTIAEVLGRQGYETAYIGKWHLDGHGRSSYIPPERRQGFEYFKVLECTHNYNRSAYYEGNDPTKRVWEGYDAAAQTEDAISYLRRHARGQKPFLLMLSWGPPHNPYETAPERFRAMYDPAKIKLRPNVPPEEAEVARRELAGYYAHCSALDECVGRLWKALRDEEIERDTIFIFTSDHGDMLHSHGEIRKQKPWDESIRVPLLVRYPRLLGEGGKRLDAPINSEDLLPTLLGLAGAEIPETVEGKGNRSRSGRGLVHFSDNSGALASKTSAENMDLSPSLPPRERLEGKDFSGYMQGGDDPSGGAALLTCPWPFGEWTRSRGGREYRGVRTRRYTYAQTLEGPWLLFDNQADPYQLKNLVNAPQYAELQAQLKGILERKLKDAGDSFLPGEVYIEKWGYPVDKNGTVPYRP